MDYEHLLFEVDDVGVATITLNRPEAMNAWTGVMTYETSDAMRRCAEDDAVRAVVITGAGRAFCAGIDMSGGANPITAGQSAPSAPRANPRGAGQPLVYPHHVPKPVIAAINGHAIGIGITYPVLADVRIVAEDAKISFMFVRRGLVPELGANAIVPRLCGAGHAAELLLSGKTILGKEAAQIGLANRALPASEVLPAAQALAREMAINAAPAAAAASKRLMWKSYGLDIDAFMKEEAAVFSWLGKQPDSTEGFASFLQKRAPNWTSRANDVPADMLK